MQRANSVKQERCKHSTQVDPSGLVLLTIGNSLRGDDGMAAMLCDMLPSSSLKEVCRFDLGLHTSLIAECLSGHKAAIIIDSTSNGTAPGTVSIVDLAILVERTSPINIGSCHGLSVADELRLAKRTQRLPKRMVFFGVEISEVAWSQKLSSSLERNLPHVSEKLSVLIQAIMEILKRDA